MVPLKDRIDGFDVNAQPLPGPGVQTVVLLKIVKVFHIVPFQR